MTTNASIVVVIAAVLAGLFLLQRKGVLQYPISLGISLCLVMISVLWIYSKYELMESSIKTQGTIVQRYESATLDGVTYCFRASFIDKQEKPHTINTRICSSKPRYSIGDKVTIAYPEAAPEEAVVSDPLEVYILPIMLGLLGLMLLSIDSYKVFRKTCP